MEIERPLVVRAGKPTGGAKGTMVRGAKGFVFLQGFGGIDPETGVTPEGLGAQAKLAWENIISALEEAGTSVENLCHAWTHLVGSFPDGMGDALAEVVKARREVWTEHYGAEVVDKNPMAGTLIGCTALARPEMLVEITAVVAIP